MNKLFFYISSAFITAGLLCGSGQCVFAKSPEHYQDINNIVDNGVNLSIPKSLGIIYPKTVFTTDKDTFYIVGTSDPSQPLYMNDQELTDIASNGIFEVTVSLPQNGVYNCVFKQGNETKVVPIFKNVQADISYNGFALPGVIRKNVLAIDSSIYPTQNIVTDKKTIKLQCSAPAGASVTADFCGVNYPMYQEKTTSEIGVAAKYYTNVDLSSIIDEEKTYKLGNVVYHINFEGNEEDKISSGNIYYSKNTPQFVKVSWAYGFLRPDSKNDNDTISVLKKGVIDRVVAVDNDKYQLSCGGWILSKFTEPIFETVDITNYISNAKFYQDSKCEKLTLNGTNNPIFTSGITGDKLIVRLYHTKGNLDFSNVIQASRLFNNISNQNNDDVLELTFDLKSSEDLWGYNIEFDGNDTIIYLKKKPSLSSDSSKPLQNLNIIVDAGHGGSDTGALGLIGEVGGAVEKDINLANSLAVKKRLESLGANVVLTRDVDKYVSLSERANMIENVKPDFVLVFHANASAINMMAKGLEIHYTNDNRFSESFSKLAAQKAIEYTERYGRNKIIVNTNFYIARNTFCPTAYYECGYLTNASDTKGLFDAQGVFDLANSVADSIIEFLSDK